MFRKIIKIANPLKKSFTTDAFPKKPIASPFLMLMGIGTSSFLMYLFILREKSLNTLQDQSVLKADHRQPFLNVESSHQFTAIGHKFKHKNGEEFYLKNCASRKEFINELIGGALGKTLLPMQFPEVKAVEVPRYDINNRADFKIASQSLGEHNMNLADWALQYSANQNNAMPKYVGVAIAYKMLFGDKDAKLANIILQNQSGDCYPINNKYTFTSKTQFLNNETDGLQQLLEFKPFGLNHLMSMMPFFSPSFEINQKIKVMISPILQQAIKNDFENGSIIQLYENFSKLSEKEIVDVFNSFGGLIHQDEIESYLQSIKHKQAQTVVFLQQQQECISLKKNQK